MIQIAYSFLFIAMPIILYISGCSKQDENITRIRDVVVNYMSDPAFINTDFTRQLTSTEAELVMYNVDEKMVYFSVPKKDFDSRTTIERICNNLTVVEYGKEENGRVDLGKYSLNGTDKIFFRFLKKNFKIDIDRIIKIDYGKYYYDISLYELADYSENKVIYGGRLDLIPEDFKNAANHGALVAKNNEPSLRRLSSQIIKNVTSKEIKAQLFLDFVTTCIKFNEKEAYGKYEVLKRPNEVLMTGKSDCSGKTILYASLLEQEGIDYRLIYYNGHINAAVEGSFPDKNNLFIELEGKKYFVAETTAKEFIIGESLLIDDIGLNNIKFVQKPGKDSEMIKYK